MTPAAKSPKPAPKPAREPNVSDICNRLRELAGWEDEDIEYAPNQIRELAQEAGRCIAILSLKLETAERELAHVKEGAALRLTSLRNLINGSDL